MATKKQETKGFDLADLKPTSDTIVVELKHPITGEDLVKDDGTVMSIEVYAPYAKEYKKVFHEQANKRLQKRSKSGKTDFTYEEIEEGSLDLLTKATVNWNLQFGGANLPFSIGKAKEIYDEYFWIKEQVMEAQGNLENFMKN